jgi:two-component system alkaline phosphatase synthesis response regulator PhoP
MKRVMIVDDHAPVIRVLKLGLEEAGYEVETAGNGSECLVKLCDAQPDFLVTDIDMPRMNGKELCLAIEKQFPDRVFPIVVLTSRTELEHRNWTADIENLSFMEKPVSIRRLVSHIKRCLPEPTLKVAG